MPYHSSKNYYRAEQEEDNDIFTEKEWKEIEEGYNRSYETFHWKYRNRPWDDIDSHIKEYSYCPWNDCVCKKRTSLYYNRWLAAFDTFWVGAVRRKAMFKLLQKGNAICVCCQTSACPHAGCRCEACYDYEQNKNLKELIKENFTPQEILETLQQHLLEKNCWCYERVRSHILLRKIDTYLRPQDSAIVTIPILSEGDIITPCVKDILERCYRNQMKEFHDTIERNWKQLLLERYGMTLEEYKQKRIERQHQLEELNKGNEIKKEPPQKFVRVRMTREELF